MRKQYSIWNEMRRIQEQMDTMFDNFFNFDPLIENNSLLLEDNNKNTNLTSNSYKAPISDLYETDKEIIAEIDIPGIKKEDIKVNITEDNIEVKALKESESKKENDKKGVFRYERNCAGFYRNFSLPNPVDSNNATAEYKNGVLKIIAPKLTIENKKKKMLEIK